jgi:hypothetical protein
VPAEVKAAYELLTGELNPLELCKKLAPLLEGIQGISAPMSAASPVKDLAMSQYVAALKQVGDSGCVGVGVGAAVWWWWWCGCVLVVVVVVGVGGWVGGWVGGCGE